MDDGIAPGDHRRPGDDPTIEHRHWIGGIAVGDSEPQRRPSCNVGAVTLTVANTTHHRSRGAAHDLSENPMLVRRVADEQHRFLRRLFVDTSYTSFHTHYVGISGGIP